MLKADKNQVFTPDHIVQFMCKVLGVNRDSRVLDPCCGSGAFLVRAMTEAMDDCETEDERELVKEECIYGIEYDEVAFGLSTTNMLIHEDGNSNIKQGNCFDQGKEIEENNINMVLMNPPYNAQKKHSNPEYVKSWDKSTTTDPSKGFHYVHYVASKVKTGTLAVLLPMSCAIGNNKEIKKFKEKMLNEHTLEAVFSMPSEIFHPGANVSSCCMVFDLGVRHEKSSIKGTFFGYFRDDGFVKKKNLGRVEYLNDDGEGIWKNIKAEWLNLYYNRIEKTSMSVIKEVSHDDEWLAEAYMETDFYHLDDLNFENKIKDYLAFEVLTGRANINKTTNKDNALKQKIRLDVDTWKEFYVDNKTHPENGLFTLDIPKGTTTDMLTEGNSIPYVAAKRDINGLRSMVDKVENEEYISDGNCIAFVALGAGSAGYATYQSKEFIGMNGKISLGYNENLNPYVGIFIATLLDLERPKYSFGRSWTGAKLKDTMIKLPVNEDDGTPDWDLMEEYIKSLPYGNVI